MDHDPAEIKRIVLSVLEDCSQCHHPHTVDDFRIVGRSGNLWVLAIQCARCSSQALVAAVVGDYGVDIADADAEAAEWLAAAESDFALVDPEIEFEPEPELQPDPVTIDDLLDMHEFLETFDGDFHALFARRHR